MKKNTKNDLVFKQCHFYKMACLRLVLSFPKLHSSRIKIGLKQTKYRSNDLVQLIRNPDAVWTSAYISRKNKQMLHVASKFWSGRVLFRWSLLSRICENLLWVFWRIRTQWGKWFVLTNRVWFWSNTMFDYISLCMEIQSFREHNLGVTPSINASSR